MAAKQEVGNHLSQMQQNAHQILEEYAIIDVRDSDFVGGTLRHSLIASAVDKNRIRRQYCKTATTQLIFQLLRLIRQVGILTQYSYSS